jgi:hypothetical protein
MRLSISALCVVIWATSVAAQIKSEDKKPGDSTYSTGRTVLPDNKGQLQPQGWPRLARGLLGGSVDRAAPRPSYRNTARHCNSILLPSFPQEQINLLKL